MITRSEMLDLLDLWEPKLRSGGASVNTVKAYADSVRAFAAWQEAEGRDGLDKTEVQLFLGAILDGWKHPGALGRRKEGGSKATADLRGRALRTFGAWLAEENETDGNVLAGLKTPKPGKPVVPKLSDDQLVALFAACAADTSIYGRRDEAICRLAAETTARADELLALNLPDDIDQKRGIVIIRHGKGDKGRVVPYGDKTTLAIGRYLRMRQKAGIKAEGPLWLSQRKTRLSYPGLYETLQKRARLAGISDMHPHRLRHTAASRYLLAGGKEGDLMAIAGWSSREMLDRYVQDCRSEMAIKNTRELNLGEL